MRKETRTVLGAVLLTVALLVLLAVACGPVSEPPPAAVDAGLVRGAIGVGAGTPTPFFSSDNDNCYEDWSGMYNVSFYDEGWPTVDTSYAMGNVVLDETVVYNGTGSCRAFGQSGNPTPARSEGYAVTTYLQSGDHNGVRLSFYLRFEEDAMDDDTWIAAIWEDTTLGEYGQYTCESYPANIGGAGCNDDPYVPCRGCEAGYDYGLNLTLTDEGNLAVIDDYDTTSYTTSTLSADTWYHIVLEAYNDNLQAECGSGGANGYLRLYVDDVLEMNVTGNAVACGIKNYLTMGVQYAVSGVNGYVWYDDVALWFDLGQTPTPTATPQIYYISEVLSSNGPTPTPTTTPTP